MTPAELDAIAYGARVYLYRRQDGTVYGSVHNLERFNVQPIEVVRVPLSIDSTVESVLADNSVQKAIDARASDLQSR